MVNSLKNRLYFFALFGRAEHEAQEADLELETRVTGYPRRVCLAFLAEAKK